MSASSATSVPAFSTSSSSSGQRIPTVFRSYMGRAMSCLKQAGSYILTKIAAIWHRVTQLFSRSSAAATPPQTAASTSPATVAAPVTPIALVVVDDTTQYHTPLLDFYRGTAPNAHGLTLDQIKSSNDDVLMNTQPYSSWCFPLRAGQPDAPLLDDRTITAFRQEPILKTNLTALFDRMLHFYGLRFDSTTTQVHFADNLRERKAVWLTPNNPHLKTITRILNSLCILGLTQHARAFKAALDDIGRDEGAREGGSRAITLTVRANWTRPFQTPPT